MKWFKINNIASDIDYRILASDEVEIRNNGYKYMNRPEEVLLTINMMKHMIAHLENELDEKYSKDTFEIVDD